MSSYEDAVQDDVAAGEWLAREGAEQRPVCDRCDRPTHRLHHLGWADPAQVCSRCMDEMHGVEPVERETP